MRKKSRRTYLKNTKTSKIEFSTKLYSIDYQTNLSGTMPSS